MPRPSPKVDKSVSIVSKTMQGLGTRLNVLEHKQFKTRFKDHMVRFNIISLYIYKHLRLNTIRSNESRDHYHEYGNLVPSPRRGFSFKVAF